MEKHTVYCNIDGRVVHFDGLVEEQSSVCVTREVLREQYLLLLFLDGVLLPITVDLNSTTSLDV